MGSSTLSAELSLRHAFNLVRVVRVADIRVAWLVYLTCLRLNELRAYCNFESKQAISITLQVIWESIISQSALSIIFFKAAHNSLRA